jgi:hypothetical protein
LSIALIDALINALVYTLVYAPLGACLESFHSIVNQFPCR